jgi:superfamily II helicase
MENLTPDKFTVALQEQQQRENQTKVCRHCGQEKPISEFYPSKKTKDGHDSWCKECKKADNRLSAKRVSASVKTLQEEVDRLRATAKGKLSQYEPRELIEELQRRGYHGEYKYTVNVKF